MPSEAPAATKKKPATKKPAKKATAKKAAPRRPSTAVVVKKPPLRDQLHPGLLASALDLADGDTRRIEALAWNSVMVTM